MGMFDNIICEAALPKEAEELKGVELQTKDTPAQFLDTYVITEDGFLFHVDYDIEDRSDPNAEGIARIFGCMTRVNERRVLEPFTGTIEFYGNSSVTGSLKSVVGTFLGGKLTKPLECLPD